MNKQELSAMIQEILGTMAPQVKATEYHATQPGPQPEQTHYSDGDFVEDVTALDLRKLYLTDSPKDKAAFARLKERTPARLGSGRAGPRYKTLTMLRFRADHAAAQDAVFSQVPEDFARKNQLTPVQTRCKDKDQYLTRIWAEPLMRKTSKRSKPLSLPLPECRSSLGTVFPPLPLPPTPWTVWVPFVTD